MNLGSLYEFNNPKWFELALTHKSYANERRATEIKMAEPKIVDSKATAASATSAQATISSMVPSDAHASGLGGISNATRPASLLLELIEDNERLEFLGDAVLSASLSARLMREFPLENEGSLSKRRASLVNEERLAGIATRLGLHEALRLGKGEIKTGGASKPRILACGLEALIGAIFFDSDYVQADRVINELFADEIRGLRESTLDFERDYKTRLQEWSHEEKGLTPSYVLLDEFGPAHSRTFRVSVSLGSREIARGEGKSKKAAEQEAACAALENIGKGETREG